MRTTSKGESLDSGEFDVVVVGTKSDLEAERTVKAADVEAFVEEEGVEHVLTSAKSGDKIKEALITLARKILEAKPSLKNLDFSGDAEIVAVK